MVYAIDISDQAVNPVAKFGSIATILNVVIPVLTSLAALFFLVMLLYAAYTFMTAGANPESIKKAQKMLTFSILGLSMIILSYLFVKLIAGFLNIQNLPL